MPRSCNKCLNEDILKNTIDNWANSLKKIGNTSNDGNQNFSCEIAIDSANTFLDLYNFDTECKKDNPVLTKPALTQFPNEYRNDKESLQSYLVGSECIDQNCKIGNQNYDNGFALAKMAGTEWSTEGWSEIIPDFSQFKFQINK